MDGSCLGRCGGASTGRKRLCAIVSSFSGAPPSSLNLLFFLLDKNKKTEFTKITSKTALGFVVMGFIGFFVKLIFIVRKLFVFRCWNSSRAKTKQTLCEADHLFSSFFLLSFQFSKTAHQPDHRRRLSGQVGLSSERGKMRVCDFISCSSAVFFKTSVVCYKKKKKAPPERKQKTKQKNFPPLTPPLSASGASRSSAPSRA